jgi:prepilin-type N-terminal cleavage/methylation domain-containing protein
MQRGNRQGGFTLVEALVALVVFGVIMVGAFTLYASNHDALRQGQTKAEVQQNARVALQVAAREIRIAGYDPSGVLPTLTSPTAIQVANPNNLTFVSDVTQDGVLDQVTYQVRDNRLIREISSWNGSSFPAPATSEVAGDIGLLTFAYFDNTTPVNTAISAPVAAADLDDIRRITISLVTSGMVVGTQEQFPLVIDVRLRN